MLHLKISDAEIQRLNYERIHYPCPMVQKRIHVVYLKATVKASLTAIGHFTDLKRQTVSLCLQTYIQGGFEALCHFNYGTNVSELESKSTSILQIFAERPPMSAREAKLRIEELIGISRSLKQVRSFMNRHGFQYIKTGHQPAGSCKCHHQGSDYHD
jgi:transposase